MTEDGYATPDEMFAYWACVMAVMLFFFVFATLGVEKLEKMIQEAETKSDTSEYETDSEAESSEETEEEEVEVPAVIDNETPDSPKSEPLPPGHRRFIPADSPE